MDKEDVIPILYINTMEHYSTIIFFFCYLSNMDGLAGLYAKKSKSDRERQIVYHISYMYNLK